MSYEDVVDRSWGMCEAMVWVREVFTRCGKRPIQIHHRLTRSRGGDVLDEHDCHHLMALCLGHHNWAHANPTSAYRSGLMIEGQAWLEGGTVVYVGPDPYLLAAYGRNSEVRSIGAGR